MPGASATICAIASLSRIRPCCWQASRAVGTLGRVLADDADRGSRIFGEDIAVREQAHRARSTIIQVSADAPELHALAEGPLAGESQWLLVHGGGSGMDGLTHRITNLSPAFAYVPRELDDGLDSLERKAAALVPAEPAPPSSPQQ